MNFRVTVNCCLCEDSHVTSIDIPDGWKTCYEGEEIDDGFCEKHAIIKEFADSQCPGCVGLWTECELWASFAYREKRALSSRDMEAIRSGVCPKRMNGWISFNSISGPEDFDFSERASPKSGEALVEAIREYWDKYGSE